VSNQGRLKLSALRLAVSGGEAREDIILDYVLSLNEESCRFIEKKLNSIATKKLSLALRLLKDVTLWTNELKRQKGLAITHNNLACTFGQRERLPEALLFLQEAMQMEMRMKEVSVPEAAENAIGETLLNMASVLSKMGRHLEALKVARRAVDELRPRIGGHLRVPRGRLGESLAIALFNVGAELEHLKDISAAKEAYEDSLQVGILASKGKSPML